MNYTLQNREKIDYRTNTIFLISWFMPVYIALAGAVYDPQTLSALEYVILCVLAGLVVFLNRRLKRKLVYFVCIYLMVLGVNTFLVDYKDFVIIEGVTGLIRFFVPIYVFSLCNKDNFDNLVNRWYKWSIIHTLLLPVTVICVKSELIHYGVAATVTVSNIVALIVGIYVLDIYKNMGKLCFIINLLILILYGSRMPAIATIVVWAFLFLQCKKRSASVKMVVAVLFSAIVVITSFYIKDIITFTNQFALSNGIESRTLMKFAGDIGTLSAMEMAESSGRDYIWSTVESYFENSMGLPGGFAVVRDLTGGRYYFAHNFFLDVYIFFGVLAVPVLAYIFFQLYRCKLMYSKKQYIWCVSFGLFFFVCSMTGAHFISNANSVIFWGMLLFYRDRRV